MSEHVAYKSRMSSVSNLRHPGADGGQGVETFQAVGKIAGFPLLGSEPDSGRKKT